MLHDMDKVLIKKVAETKINADKRLRKRIQPGHKNRGRSNNSIEEKNKKTIQDKRIRKKIQPRHKSRGRITWPKEEKTERSNQIGKR